MIKTRLLAKAKSGSSGGSVTLGASGMSYTNGTQYAAKAEEANTAKTAQYADTAGSADEAKHAASAAALDEKAAAALDEKYLSKVNADTAAGKITFADGMALGDGTAYGADKDGAATMKSVTAETIAASTSVGNGDFVSGYAAGSGWSVYSTLVNKVKKWTLEIDNLVVRSALKVYEMVVSQLVGENDNRIFAACGEVAGINLRTGKIYIYTEAGGKLNPFRAGDILECQQYQPNGEDISKHYRLVVNEVGTITYKKETCAYVTVVSGSLVDLTNNGGKWNLITAGDTLVRVDSTSDESRKGIVGITSVGEKTPYLDVIYGKTTETNPLKVRMGNLSGVTDENFGGALSGWGLYAENAYLKGAVHADSGYFKGEIQATSGTFENGTFTKCTSKEGTFEEGTFNKGTFTDITAVNGTFDNGTFTNANVEGTITASAGCFGPLRISDSGSLYSEGSFLIKAPSMTFTNDCTEYYETDGNNLLTRCVRVGMASSLADPELRHQDGLNAGMYIFNKARIYDRGLVINLQNYDSSDTNDKAAIMMKGGYLEGLKLRAEYRGRKNIGEYVSVYAASESGTYYLPDFGTRTQYIGHTIFFKNVSGGEYSVNVKAQGNNIIQMGGDWVTDFYVWQEGDAVMLVFFPLITKEVDGTTYHGAWIAFSMGRNLN